VVEQVQAAPTDVSVLVEEGFGGGEHRPRTRYTALGLYAAILGRQAVMQCRG
jgi:hypothetical protein